MKYHDTFMSSELGKIQITRKKNYYCDRRKKTPNNFIPIPHSFEILMKYMYNNERNEEKYTFRINI